MQCAAPLAWVISGLILSSAGSSEPAFCEVIAIDGFSIIANMCDDRLIIIKIYGAKTAEGIQICNQYYRCWFIFMIIIPDG